MSETSPTARALRVLELLQERPGIRADELAARLGVSDRATRRYVAILREAGIPVESARGPYGGYRLGRGLRLPPLVFSAEEALALVMAVLDGHHDPDADDPAGSALGKIVRALPDPVAARAAAVRRTAAAAPDRGAARPDPLTTSELVRASSDLRRVRLGYRSEAGTTWTREVEPWAIVVRHGRWYLLCRDLEAQARRAYRVDRVRSVEVLDSPFVRPSGLDPVVELEAHLGSGWEFAAEVLIEAPADQVRSWLPAHLGRLEALGGQRCRLVGSTSNLGEYAERLAGLPVSFRVEGGPELRAAVQEVGARMTAAVEE
ncbi:helix-turn-helix transcriptional regulator [Nocardioides coralli]|uniref:helix-turn-helix transcriptional regulator n=1 Tax=Nocardioides coralli TaxID=2872154 RepID=UPI001CA430F0|nr:WYL domain-containing protein [Nocardioides coralli]QZY29101.1 WYL domain-containing protein [Nocardioides coralli]